MNLRRTALETLTSRMPPARVIWSRLGDSPYLSRHYIAGREKVDREVAAPIRRALIRTENHGAYLHHFHRSDEEPELHSHPWEWSASLILVGGYREERRIGNRVVRRYFYPGQVNWLGAKDFHRVDLLERDCWTLFFTGPRVGEDDSCWGFWNRDTDLYLPCPEFIRRVRSGKHFRPHTGFNHELVSQGDWLPVCRLCGEETTQGVYVS